jgi:hypothetical protein
MGGGIAIAVDTAVMASCLRAAQDTTAGAGRDVRVLRWAFTRNGERISCELALTRDDFAYELRVHRPDSPDGPTTESFADAMRAFHKQAELERELVAQGWSLESFESTTAPRSDGR